MKKFYPYFVLCLFLMTIGGYAQGAGKALDFDGSDDYVSIAPSGTVSGSFTVEAWVQPKDATKTMHILCATGYGDYSFDIQLRYGNLIHANIGNGVNWLVNNANATYNYKVGEWFHLAYVVTPETCLIYVNGNHLASKPLPNTGAPPLLMDTTRKIELGRHPAANTYFRGALDDVKIYNTALNYIQIQADMNSETPSLPANCIINYTFNSGTANANNPGLSSLTNNVAGGNYAGTLNMFWLQSPIGNWTTDRTAANVSVGDKYWVATLKEAFDLIHSGAYLSGDIDVKIMGNTTETSTAVLNASGSGSAPYTSVTISAQGARTISGNLSMPLIEINGADNVTFDGINANGNQLTIQNLHNSNWGTNTTISFVNGADGNTVTNCTLLGINKGIDSGIVKFFSGSSSNAGTPNNNNIISNCVIGGVGNNLISNGIYFGGTNYSGGNTVTNNSIYNFGDGSNTGGVSVFGNYGEHTISSNRFYQTQPRNFGTNYHYAIQVYDTYANGANFNYAITGNTIGYANASGTGKYDLTFTNGTFIGIRLYDYKNGLGSTIQNNTIAGLKIVNGSSIGFKGIECSEGNLLISGNTIGSMTENENIELNWSATEEYALKIIDLTNFTTTLDATIDGNNIGGITVTSVAPIRFTGIYCPNNGTITCTNNTIGSTLANSLYFPTVTLNGTVTGIHYPNAGNVSGNTVRNITSGYRSIEGLNIGGYGSNLVSKNSIYNLRNINTEYEATIVGISKYNFNNDSNVNANSIHSFYIDFENQNAQLRGLYIWGNGALCYNNMVALGNGVTKAYRITGLYMDTSSSSPTYNNSVFIGGDQLLNNASSFASFFNAPNNANFTNNIMVNNRSNSNGISGSNYSIRVNGSASNPTFANNIYHGTGNGYILGYRSGNHTILTAWQSAIANDSSSYFSDPGFIDPTAAVPNLHINPSVATLVEGFGTITASLSEDIDGETRSGLTPSDIGADAGNFTALAPATISSLSSTSGCPGSTLVINGANLLETTLVKIGTTNAVITNKTNTTVTVTINAGTSGTVTITTPRGSIASTETFTVFTEPAITTQPPVWVTACPWNSVTTISVTTSNTSSYQWLKNGQPIVNGGIYSNATTASLRITNPEVSENGSVYSVAITNESNCITVISNNSTLTVNDQPDFTITSPNTTICNGGSTPINVSGSYYSITWSPNEELSSLSSNTIASPKQTTTFTVTAFFSSGCSRSKSITIYVNQKPDVQITPASQSICVGGNVTLEASGAQNYTWSPATGLNTTSGATVIASPTTTRTYTVTGTDANGCTSTKTVTVTVNSLPTVTITPASAAICLGSNRVLTASGGVSYEWSPATGLSATTGESVTANPTTTTTYTVKATNANGCQNTKTVVVTVNNPSVNISPENPMTCQENPVTLTAFGGISYIWSPATGLNTTTGASVIATPLTTTTYTVSSTDANNCIIEKTVTVTVNEKPTISINPSSTISCAGNPVTLTATGATSYTWSPAIGLSSTTGNSIVASPLTTTTYTATGTDENGCVNTATVTIQINELSVVTTPPVIGICQGATTMISVTGMDTYTWSPATGLNTTSGATVNASPSVTTTYTVTGSSAGCITTASFTVYVKKPITISSPGSLNFCSASSISLHNSKSVLRFDGTNDSMLINRNIADDFTIEFRMRTTQTGNTILSQWYGGTGIIDAEVGGTVNDFGISLLGSKIIFGVGGGGADTSIQSISNVNTGKWINVSVTRSKTSGEIAIYINGIKESSIIASTVSLSSPNAIRIGGLLPGGSHFNGYIDDIRIWNSVRSQSQIASGMDTDYSIGTPDLVDYFKLDQRAGSTAENAVNPSNNGQLQNGPAWVDNPAYSYVWSNGETTPQLTVTESGNYSVQVTDEDGCILDSNDLNIIENPEIPLVVTTSNETICPESSATLTASGADTYSWSPASGLNTTTGDTVTASPAETTTYTVTGTLSDGCTTTKTITVNIPSLAMNVTGNTQICAGGSTVLSASGASTYVWSPATGLSSTTGTSVAASPEFSTLYTVTGTTAAGCSIISHIEVNVIPKVLISANQSTTICDSGTVTLSAAPYSPSLYFDGVDDNFQILRRIGYNFTVEFWIKTTQTAAIGQWYNGIGIVDAEVGGARRDFGISLIGNKIAFGSGPNDRTETSNAIVNTGEWVHVAISRAISGDIAIYINGNLDKSLNAGNNYAILSDSSVITIGSISNGGNFFKGSLDEIRTWDVVRSQAQIQASMNVSLPNGTTGLIDYFRMDENNGTLLHNFGDNLSSNANYNNAVWQQRPLGGNYSSYLWSNGATTPTINVGEGNYSVTVTDAAGCSMTSAVQPVNIVTTSQVSVSADKLVNCPATVATLTASGAVTYNWSPATGLNKTTGETVIANPATATTYTVTGTDSNGCTSTATITITPEIPPAIILTSTNSNLCRGESTTLTASGFATYSWSPASGLSATTGDSVIATPLRTTTYTVTGTSVNGCTNTQTITIVVDMIRRPVVSLSGNPKICPDDSIFLTAENVFARFNGNDNYATINRNIADDFTIEYWLKTPATGADGPDWFYGNGIVDADILGNTDDFGTSLCGNKLAFGVGDFTIRSVTPVNTNTWVHVAATRSKATGEIKLYINGELESSGMSQNTNSLTNPDTIAIGRLLRGDSYLQADINGLRIWNVVRNAEEIAVNMDTDYNSVTPGLVDFIRFNDYTTTPTAKNSINPTNNAELHGVTFYTDNPGYISYLWSNGWTTDYNFAYSEMLGDFSVEVTGANGCKMTSNTVTVSDGTPVLDIAATENTVCRGSNSTLTVTGALTYIWSPSSGLNTATGNTVIATPETTTTYTVTGTSEMGCIATKTITVNVIQPENININATSTSICPGASVILTASGDSNSFTWSPATGLSATTGTTITATPTQTTTYTVSGIGTTNGCPIVKTITITVNLPAGPIVVETANPSCSGTVLTVEKELNDPALSFNGVNQQISHFGDIDGNDFTIEFWMKTAQTGTIGTDWSDGKGLVDATDFNLAIDYGVTLLGSKIAFGIGNGTSNYTLTSASDVTTGEWIHIAATRNKATGIMKIYLNGAENASGNSNNTLTIPPLMAFSIGRIRTGGGFYNGHLDEVRIWNTERSSLEIWSNMLNDIPVNTPGLFVNYRFDENSGTAIYDTAQGSYTNGISNTSQWQTRTRSKNYQSYLWSNGETTDSMNATIAGDYSVTVTDINGCATTSDLIRVDYNANDFPTILVTPSASTICPQRNVTLTASGALSYSWYPATGLNTTTGETVIASPEVTTTYAVTGTTANGCYDVTEVTVTVNVPQPITITPENPQICSGASTTLTATGGIAYSWSPATGLNTTTEDVVIATPEHTTTYTVAVTDSNGCISSKTVTVTVNSYPTVSIYAPNNVICNSCNVNLTAYGADSYTWSPAIGLSATTGANVTASPMETTTYTITGTRNGCETSTTYTVNVHESPTVTINAADMIICPSGSTTLTAQGATSYVWSPAVGLYTNTGATVTVAPSQTTTYTVTGTNSVGLTNTASITITVTEPSVSINSSDVTLCSGSSVLTAFGAVSYSWSPSDGLDTTTGNSVIASPIQTTTYTVTGTDSNGCTSTATTTVTKTQLAGFSLSSSKPYIATGESTTLTASGIVTANWSPATGLDTTSGTTVIASPSVTTTYTVTATNTNGCIGSLQITVLVTNPEILASGPTQFCTGGNVTLSITPVEDDALVIKDHKFPRITNTISNDFTIEYWMKTTQTGVFLTPQWYGGTGIIDAEVSGNTNDFGISLLGDKIAFGVGGGGNTDDFSIVSNTAVNTGEWVHVAVTRAQHSGELKIYINGIEEASAFAPNTNSLNSSPDILLGIVHENYSSFYNGSIDELRFWNVVRSQSQIQENMNISLQTSSGLTDNFQFGSSAITANSANPANPVYQYGNSPWLSDSRAIPYSNYLWSNGATTPSITVTESGDYSVVLNNTVTLPATSVTVGEIYVDLNASSTLVCGNDSITLTASGAETYTWSPSAFLSSTTGATVTANPISNIVYTVTATAANGCSTTKSVAILVSEAYVSLNTSATQIDPGESVILTASGNTTAYSWSPATGLNATSGNEVIATPAVTTTYTVTGTNNQGCTDSKSVIVNVSLPNPKILALGETSVCPGQSVSLSAVLPSDNPAIAIKENFRTGFLSEISEDFTVEYWLKTTITATPEWPGANLAYSAKIISSYDYNSLFGFMMGILDGKLIAGFTNLNDGTPFSITSAANVNSGEWMHIAFSHSMNTGEMKMYINGNLEASGTSPVNFPLDFQSFEIGNYSPLFSGSLDEIRVWNNVRSQNEIQLNATTDFSAGNANLKNYFPCNEGTGWPYDHSAFNYMYVSNWDSRSMNNSTSYLWSNGETSQSISVSEAGSYTVTTSDENGLTLSSEPVQITVGLPDITISGNPTICPGNSTQLQALSGTAMSYNWTPATGLDTQYGAVVVASPDKTTTYTVYGRTASGCLTSKTITIVVSPEIAAIASSPSICPGGSTSITASGALNYSWSPSTGLNTTIGSNVVANPAVTTTYTITGSDASGCTNAATITITVAPMQASVVEKSRSCNGNIVLSVESSHISPALQFNSQSATSTLYAGVNNDFTIEYWMKTAQSSISIPANSQWYEGIPIISASGIMADHFGFAMINNKLAFGIKGGPDGDTTTYSTSTINTDEWTHIAATYSSSSGEISLYINGVKESSALSTAGSFYSSYMYIGQFADNDGVRFEGAVDDFRSWSSIRTVSEIAENRNAVLTVLPTDLRGYYPMDENSDYYTYDLINSGNSMTLFDNVEWISREKAPITYLWSTGETTPTINVATAGNYNVTLTADSCSATSGDFTVILETPSVVLTASETSVCAGEAVTLTASGYHNYYWTPDNLYDDPYSDQVTVYPNVTTTYTVAGESSDGCTSFKSITIYVAEPIVVTPDTASVCDTAVALTANGGIQKTYLLQENFNDGATDWTIENAPGSATDANWKIVATPYRWYNSYFYSAEEGQMLISDSDAGGEDSFNDTYIMSPVFSTMGQKSAVLTFQHARPNYLGGDTAAAVEISTDGGTTWILLKSYLGTATPLSYATVSLNDYLNQPNLRIRYHFASNWGYYWFIDDIKVTATPFSAATWSPVTGLYTDLAATIPYTGEETFIVYAKPSALTQYTVISSDNCMTTAVADVMVLSTAIEGIVSSNQTICYGLLATDLILTGTTNAVTKWQLSNNVSFTNAIDIANTSNTLTGSEIGFITETSYIRAVMSNGSCSSVSDYVTLTVNATTWNGTSWSNGTPTASMTAIIGGTFSSTEDLWACSLIIKDNATVSVNAGHDFHITGKVDVQSGSLTFANTANLFQDAAAVTNENSGNITYKRNSTMRRFDYVYWGSPVESQNLGGFSPWTVQPSSNPGVNGASRFYDLDEATNAFVQIPQPTTVSWSAGKGFMVRAPNNFNTLGNLQTWTGAFTGRPNNGTITVPISWTASNRGYNMIGNPYPSPIDADAFLSANPGTLYFWTHFSQVNAGGDNYGKYNASGYVKAVGDLFSLEPGQSLSIAPAQGFILRKANANQSVATFTNAMRRDENDVHFFRSSNTIEKHRIWLSLSNSTTSRFNQALIAYVTDATQGADERFDGTLYYSGTSISSAISGDTKKYVIQGRALPFDASDVVPLIFKAETEGTYTLSLDQVDGLFDGDQDIFLKDNLTGIEHDIKGGVYTFASTVGTFTDRFAIVYQSTLGTENPTLDPNAIVVFKKDGILNVNSGNVTMDTIKLFDMRGRLIYEKSVIGANATSLNDLRAEQQVLLIQITSDDNKTVTKKVVY